MDKKNIKIVVAIDSFKGAATSAELNAAVKEEIFHLLPMAKVETFTIADGGEGTLAAINDRLKGEKVEVETVDLLGKPIKAKYLLVDKLAIIEAAEVIGIDKINPTIETIKRASSFGLAALFIDAKARGALEIVLALGGTGTSDGGLGLLAGLGAKCERTLDKFNGIDLSDMQDFNNIKISAFADVKNIYSGELGFAKIYGKQKGGTKEYLFKQNQISERIVKIVNDRYNINLQEIEGTGAAGGLGGAVTLLGGKVEQGFKKISELIGINKEIADAELVITGEGKIDSQTGSGKVPYGVALLSEKNGKKPIAFCGIVEDELGIYEKNFLAIYSIQRNILTKEKAMEKERTILNIKELTKNVIKTRYF